MLCNFSSFWGHCIGLVLCVVLLSLCAPQRMLLAQTPKIDSLKRALESAPSERDKFFILKSLLWEYRSIEPLQGLAYGRRAYQIAMRADSAQRLAGSAGNALFANRDDFELELQSLYIFLGVAYRNTGEYNKAAECVYKSLEINKRRGDSLQIGHGLNTLGRILLLQNNIAAADTTVLQAYGIAERLGLRDLMAYSAFTLSDICFAEKKYDDALRLAEKALTLRKEQGEKVHAAAIMLAIAKNYALLGKFENAERYAREALAVYQAQGLLYNKAVGNNAMAQLYLFWKRPKLAAPFALEAFRLADSTGAKGLAREAAAFAADAYAGMGEYERAFQWQKTFQALNDALFSEKVAQTSALLNIEYETRIKEEQIRAYEQEKRFGQLVSAVVIALFGLALFAAVVFFLRLRARAREAVEQRRRADELVRVNEDLHRAQADLHEKQEQLERALRQIRVRNEELKELNHEKNMMLGMVSHDLKNPIVAIEGLAEMMATDEDLGLEQYREFSGVVQRTASRMYDLVKNLLDLARMEEGNLRLRFISFDVAEFITPILDEYRAIAKKKGIAVVYNKPPHSVPITADEIALRQVLDNLLSNAVKYSPSGTTVRVSVEITLTMPHNIVLFATDIDNFDESQLVACARIIVSDEGPGFTEEDKAKIFQKFTRLSAQPTGGESSTGLGLAIVKSLVEAMHGRVWCESEYGYGARFTVELPGSQNAENPLASAWL